MDVDAAVRGYFDAFNRRDVDEILALSTEDVVLLAPAVAVDAERYAGREGAIEFFAAIDRLWSEFTCVPEEVVVEDDRVFATGPAHTVGRFDGVTVDTEFFIVLGRRDGKFSRLQGFLTREAALTLFRERA